MRGLFVFVSLLSLTLQAQVSCEKHIEKMFFDRVEYAAKVLNLSKDEFQSRLQRFNFSEEHFFKLVDEYKNGKKVRYWDFILNPKKLIEIIQGRQVTNTNFVSSFFTMATLHTGAQIFAHISTLGFAKLDLLSAQLMALIMTEIALTMSSAKHAAYLVANPKLSTNVKGVYNNLSKEEKGVFLKVKNLLRKIKVEAVDVSRKTAAKVVPMGKVAFVTSLVPFSYLATTTTNEISEMIVATLINSGFHTAFISVWANFRYEIFYGKLFPTINNSFIANSKVAEKSLITSLVAANMLVASYTYTYGNSMTWSFSKE